MKHVFFFGTALVIIVCIINVSVVKHFNPLIKPGKIRIYNAIQAPEWKENSTVNNVPIYNQISAVLTPKSEHNKLIINTLNKINADSTIPKLTQDASIKLSNSVKRVLFIGDSELETLRLPFNSYLKSNGIELVASVIWYGSATKHWALTDSLLRYIKFYKPDFVMIALGLNEVHVTDLYARNRYVNSIKSTLEHFELEYFWIGPACWTKDQGIVSVISNTFNDRFFPSHQLKLDRGKDGKHPTLQASWSWMQSVVLHLNTYNILSLNEPQDIGLNTERPKTIIWPVPNW